MFTAVASSPLSVGSRGSCKRTNSRGSTGSALPSARPAANSLSGAAEQGLSASQLFNLSISGRRNVSTSPTGGAEPEGCSRGAASSAAVTVLGFAAPHSCGTTATLSNSPQPVPKPTKGRGLLARALTVEDAALPSERSSTPAPPPQLEAQVSSLYGALGYSSQGPSQWAYPDVDRTLLQDLQERHAVFHSELVSMAYMLAAKAHAGQLRKDGTSQLSHGAMTALQLAELGLDAETVAAGLLHEVLRCNPAFRAQMEEFMPHAVIDLVDRVTTISEISQLYRHSKGALGEEKMRRLLLAMEDVKAMLVKLACRVHNMKTLGALPREAQVALAQETLDVFSVVANRLGVWSLKAELEDLAFSVLHPDECEALRAQVSRRQNPEALEGTIQRIKDALDERKVRYEDISGRPKNLYGIWTKMRANPGVSLDQIYDVTALRVVVTNKHDCYVALRCLQEVYRTMPGRSKDYIRGNRKPNGYQSLHETIYGEGHMPVEVQIRTHKMHYIAEYGFAAHWKYKEKLSNEDEWLDKEVQYKKWLTTYKLNLNDKKVRAAGAPPRETALDALGMHLIDATAVTHGSPPQQQPRPVQALQQQQAAGAAAAAGGRASVTVVDPFLQHDRFRLQAPTKQKVEVVLQTQDSIDLRDYPAGFSVSSLATELQVAQLPGYVLLVNQRLPLPGQELRSGDLVQVLPQPAPRVVAASAPPLHTSAPSALAAMAAAAAQRASRPTTGSPAGSPAASPAAAPSLPSRSIVSAAAGPLGRPPLAAMLPAAANSGSGSNNVVPVPLSLSSRRRASSAAAGGAAARAVAEAAAATPPSVVCV